MGRGVRESFALVAIIAEEVIGTDGTAQHAGCIPLPQTAAALAGTLIGVAEGLLLDAALTGVVPQPFPRTPRRLILPVGQMGEFHGKEAFEDSREAITSRDILGPITLTADGGFAVEHGEVAIGPEAAVALVLITLSWVGQHVLFDAHGLEEVALGCVVGDDFGEGAEGGEVVARVDRALCAHVCFGVFDGLSHVEAVVVEVHALTRIHFI
jgi:hypothetical protein